MEKWKLIALTISLRSPKAIHLLPCEHWEILGRLEVWWEKVACWSTNAVMSMKHVKIEEKILWRAYRNSPTLVPTVPSPNPLQSHLPQDWGFATSSQNFNRYCAPAGHFFPPTSSVPQISPCSPGSRWMAFALRRAKASG